MEVIDVINRIYKNKESDKWKMIYHAALTYDVSVDTLSSILNVDKKILLNQLYLQTDALNSKICITNQEDAERNFIHFFVRLFNAGVKKDKDLQNSIVDEVVGIDKDMKKLMSKYKQGDELTLEETLVALRYQIKYSISTQRLSTDYLYGLDRFKYTNSVISLSDEYSNLKSNFDDLSNFYDLKFRQNHIYNQSKGMR